MSTLAVERTLIILKYMAGASDPVSESEISKKLGYSPSMVNKIMKALSVQDFVKQNPDNNLYSLGPASLHIGLAGLEGSSFHKTARTYMEEMTNKCNETSILGIREGTGIIYIDKVLCRQEIRSDPPLGMFRPMNCTAIGKVVLSDMPAEQMEQLSSDGAFIKSNENSISDISILQKQLKQIKLNGFSEDYEEYVNGAICFASPIKDFKGRVVAAISLAGPKQRILAKKEELIELLITYSKKISSEMGYIKDIGK